MNELWIPLLCLILPATGGSAPPDSTRGAPRADEREAMVRDQIEARGIVDARVLRAMRRVPRHEFVPEAWRPLAYTDGPLPIGEGQTISQPLIVAMMSAALELRPGDRVLEVGTGSGYQAAVLAEMGVEVWTIEIVPALAVRAAMDLARLGYGEVHTRDGDGYRGWPEAAPFDAILITAAPDHVPEPLVEQLKPGGRMILPLGGVRQDLVLLTKDAGGKISRTRLLPVRFVPMTGEAERKP